MDRGEENGCDEKDKNIPEEVMSAIYFTLEELSEIFHNIKGAKEVGRNVGSSYKHRKDYENLESIKKMFCIISYMRRR